MYKIQRTVFAKDELETTVAVHLNEYGYKIGRAYPNHMTMVLRLTSVEMDMLYDLLTETRRTLNEKLQSSR